MNKLKKYFIFAVKVSEYLVLGLLFVIFFVALSPRLPTKNIFTAFIIPSGSMEPYVKSGSIALVNTQKSENIQIGDIIAFKSPIENNKTILHRVSQVGENGYITKGDNNNSEDNWIVPKSDVKGKMITSVPYLGNLAAFIRTPLGFFLMVYTPGAFLLALHLMNIYEGLVESFGNRKSRGFVILVPFIIGMVSLSTLFASKTVYAQWSDTATISGINISTVDSTLPPTCQNGVDLHFDSLAKILIISVTIHDNNVVLLSIPFWKPATVNYTLTYETDTVTQAVKGQSKVKPFHLLSEKIFMGSCSPGSCVKHIVIGCPKLKVEID